MLVDGRAPNNVLRGAGICGIDRADIPGSPPRYRARFFSPDRRQSRHPQENKMRAARDAGDLPIPTVSCRKEKRHESCSHHGFRVFPERPAHGVLGLLRTNPGGLTWPSLLRTGRSLSTAGRGPTPDAPYLGYERPRPGDPNCGARSARRAPCGLGRRNARASHAAAVAALPRLQERLRKTPLQRARLIGI